MKVKPLPPTGWPPFDLPGYTVNLETGAVRQSFYRWVAGNPLDGVMFGYGGVWKPTQQRMGDLTLYKRLA